ncbi:transposase [Nocardia sp. CWNU-33]|uniref:transposase n=1 Tax=Nocardia sp. CWNU-33 TaxID=3392117 RepID=UPI00398E3C2D
MLWRAAHLAGLRNLPFHRFDANRVWLALVTLALDLTAWMQTLALTNHPARRWEAKTPRLRLFPIPARPARRDRSVHLCLSAHNPWTNLALGAPPAWQVNSTNCPYNHRKDITGPVEPGSPPADTGRSTTPTRPDTIRKSQSEPDHAGEKSRLVLHKLLEFFRLLHLLFLL